ncbi:MAG: hypothetical protein WC707_00230 [Candidatus Babeliaceae bacterium]|jgi:hypothetical protein
MMNLQKIMVSVLIVISCAPKLWAVKYQKFQLNKAQINRISECVSQDFAVFRDRQSLLLDALPNSIDANFPFKVFRNNFVTWNVILEQVDLIDPKFRKRYALSLLEHKSLMKDEIEQQIRYAELIKNKIDNRLNKALQKISQYTSSAPESCKALVNAQKLSPVICTLCKHIQYKQINADQRSALYAISDIATEYYFKKYPPII